MAKPIHLFISSSPDLVLEREALGQAAAELPVSVGWEIRHTPRPGEDALEAAEFIVRSDFVLLVLGADFAAPMGFEWQQALRSGKPLLAYAKRALHSPSAQTALRDWSLTWVSFDAPHELKASATRALARLLLDHGEQFGLHLSEVEPLSEVAGVDQKDAEQGVDDRRLGAERGGVILGRGTE
jgi:hypothetical protein